MAKSKKTWVIEQIFESLWLPDEGRLERTIVLMSDVAKVINARATELPEDGDASAFNPANFLKDVGRRVKSANNIWPRSVFARGYSGRQFIGDQGVFEFIPIAPGQAEPFPEPFLTPVHVTPNVFDVETLSISLAVKDLGRSDESFLVQALVNVRAIESHFALTSKRQVLQVDFLQTNVKLGQGEADALFLLTERADGGVTSNIVATCEVKGKGEVAWPDQIRRQVTAFLNSKQGKNHYGVVPLYVQALGKNMIRVVELEIVKKSEIKEFQDSDLQIVAESRIRLVPPIPGLK